MIRVEDGTVHAVTPAWFQRNVIEAGVTRMNEARRLAILEVSNERRITAKERRELEALTDFLNVNSAWREFGDFYKEHYPALDHAHGMLARKPCGCEIILMHDHYGKLPMVAHRTEVACFEHGPRAHEDAEAHWAALQAEDRAALV